RGRYRRHENLASARARGGPAKILDVSSEGRVIGPIFNRPDACFGRHAVDRARHRLREEIREPLTVAAEPAQRNRLLGTNLETADALEDVHGPARFAELAVVDDVEADVDLALHDLLD